MTRELLEAEILNDWPTPNTYDPKFKEPPKTAGVYVIYAKRIGVGIEHLITGKDECVYVGSSKNLFERYDKHPVRNKKGFVCYVFYWLEEPNYYEVEKTMIKILRPALNKQHNG